jgi:outer membrane receptor for ferrienterochelin and colicins
MSSCPILAKLRLPVLCCGALCLAFAATARSAAQTAAEGNLSEMSLEDILKLRVSVTSLVEKPLDEAPGIVSIITREEIENSGARTLDDLLVFIPGITPGQDEQNARGYGVRGLWAMEGKMLVLLDGVRMNEPLYGNTIFARQFSVDLIERIEIIRGPASAVYGEFGELAVLNIVSRGPGERGGAAYVTYGQGRETYNRATASAGWWGRVRNVGVSVSGSVGSGHLGNGDYTDKYGETFPLDHFNGQDLWTLNAGIGYQALTLRFIGSSLHQETHMSRGYDADGNFQPGPEKPVSTTFDSYNLDAKYAWKPVEALTITPRLTYHQCYSWQKNEEWVFDAVTDPYDARGYYRDFPDSRICTGASAAWEMTPKMTLVLGGEWDRETIQARLPSVAAGDPWGYYYFYGDDTTKVKGDVYSFFGEYDLRTPVVDVTVGGRIDKSSRYEAARLPRLALTRRWGDFYVKGLTSRAYHPPTLMTTSWLDPEIQPEYATEYEAEVGYKPSEQALLRLNAFAIDMKPVIFYSGLFSNTTARSRGVEAEARFQNQRGRLDATYSFYRAHYDDRENAMAADEDGNLVGDVTLGFPTHKATLNGSVKIVEGVYVSPGIVWFSRRYSRSSLRFWDGEGEDYTSVNRVMESAVLVNLYSRAVFLSGWEVGAGVFNLFDEEYSSITGSYIGNPPVPGPSREFVVRVGYCF